MDRPQANAVQMVDDARVRVTRFEFAPNAETGWHEHGFDYVITAITDCHMLLEEPTGKSREVSVNAGESYRRDKGVRHNVINNGNGLMCFVEVELK
ncbi:MAG: cupin [Rhizobiaceae bacterium]|nr:cupin [Rhizobiaceae bacterium]